MHKVVQPTTAMSLRSKSSRSILEKSIFIFVTVFVVATCSVWQENVRPKLYVELGKFAIRLYLLLKWCICTSICSCRHCDIFIIDFFTVMCLVSFLFLFRSSVRETKQHTKYCFLCCVKRLGSLVSLRKILGIDLG